MPCLGAMLGMKLKTWEQLRDRVKILYRIMIIYLFTSTIVMGMLCFDPVFVMGMAVMNFVVLCTLFLIYFILVIRESIIEEIRRGRASE